MSDKKILVGDMSRETAIGILKLMLDAMEVCDSIAPTPQRRNAVQMAIASLETDEAYQLMEEQPEFCANCIDRKALLAELDKRMKNFKGFVGSCNGITSGIYQFVQGMPSVLPKADKPTIIDWNNCHTPEQLDSIATTKNDLAVEKTDMIDKSNFSQEQYKTDLQSAYDCGYEQAKNDLGVDCISRQAAIDAIRRIHPIDTNYDCTLFDKVDVMYVLNDLPPVTPQEPRWIPTSERLPEESYNSILGWDAYRERCVLVQYVDGHFQITGKAESFDIKAWMPLPAYREVEECQEKK